MKHCDGYTGAAACAAALPAATQGVVVYIQAKDTMVELNFNF